MQNKNAQSNGVVMRRGALLVCIIMINYEKL